MALEDCCPRYVDWSSREQRWKGRWERTGPNGGFPGDLVVKMSPPNAGGAGSTPGQGTETPHRSWLKNQNIKQKQYCNSLNKDFWKNDPHQKKTNKQKTLKKNKTKRCDVLELSGWKENRAVWMSSLLHVITPNPGHTQSPPSHPREAAPCHPTDLRLNSGDTAHLYPRRLDFPHLNEQNLGLSAWLPATGSRMTAEHSHIGSK